jgi:hypothetical protein
MPCYAWSRKVCDCTRPAAGALTWEGGEEESSQQVECSEGDHGSTIGVLVRQSPNQVGADDATCTGDSQAISAQDVSPGTERKKSQSVIIAEAQVHLSESTGIYRARGCRLHRSMPGVQHTQAAAQARCVKAGAQAFKACTSSSAQTIDICQGSSSLSFSMVPPSSQVGQRALNMLCRAFRGLSEAWHGHDECNGSRQGLSDCSKEPIQAL